MCASTINLSGYAACDSCPNSCLEGDRTTAAVEEHGNKTNGGELQLSAATKIGEKTLVEKYKQSRPPSSFYELLQDVSFMRRSLRPHLHPSFVCRPLTGVELYSTGLLTRTLPISPSVCWTGEPAT